jgi:hypothetical protein
LLVKKGIGGQKITLRHSAVPPRNSALLKKRRGLLVKKGHSAVPPRNLLIKKITLRHSAVPPRNSALLKNY